MLKLVNIKKDYKVASSKVHALKGVDLCFRENEFVGVLGPSGCGKTTLLNIIGGLDHYTEGDLVIEGKSTKDFNDRDWDVYRNHRIGFIFQSYNLIPHQTILGNVELALTIAGISREERVARAKEALEKVGLGGEINKRPNQLSGGQMQRVAIARALVNNPTILLADEPTGALDSKTSVEVMELIREIAGDRLVIMVTHNPELAEEYATRIVRLKDGEIESDSNPYTEAEEEAERLNKKPVETPAVAEEQAEEGKKGKKHKKQRAKMGIFTALALSFRNLLTKKGRTILTSIGGSIGIISVCLVLALSNGFNHYIQKTEEDMLSYYPVEITESTIDITAIMSNASSASKMPDLKELGDKVYVNSFLTSLAQGIAVTNNISEEYIAYLDKGKEDHPDWISAIQYSYGVSITNNLVTGVETGGVKDPKTGVVSPVETQYLSLSELKTFYTNELVSLAPEYKALLGYANFFGNIGGIMPGTEDNTQKDYAQYVLSQYDILDEETMYFPKDVGEAVLVVGGNNDATDLTLAQLGFLPEVDFMHLFHMGEEGHEEEGGYKAISFEDILNKEYVLYYNDAMYTRQKTNTPLEQPFYYNGKKDRLTATEKGKEVGIPIKITAVLRLKEGRTYGCLTSGLNLTESTITKYIEKNKKSEIVSWMQSDDAKVSETLSQLLAAAIPGVEGMDAYKSPAANLNDNYTLLPLATIRSALVDEAGKQFIEALEKSGMQIGESITQQQLQMLAANLTMMPDSPFDAEAVEKLKDNCLQYGDVIERDDLANALGDVLIEITVEKALGFELVGSLYVTYMPESLIRLLGGDDTPNSVFIYPTNFNAKDNVLNYLDAWNDMEGRAEADKITYTDRVGLLMGMMQTMLNAITYVLVAFTGISLVVSSVMIGIITYVSVVERVKEIGVLRSLGARKKDIKNLFNAETFMIGLTAGLIGVIVSYLLSFVINAILDPLTGITGLASLNPVAALIMIAISVVLTLISGLIPASAAAKKDPVIALRTE